MSNIRRKLEERTEFKTPCKISKNQKKILAEFITSNFFYRKGLFILKDDTQNKDALWEQITEELNERGSRKSAIGWRKTCADLRMHVKKKVMDGKELSSEELEFAQFYGMGLEGGEQNSTVCYERLSSNQKSRMIDLVCENFTFNIATSKLDPVSPDSLSWNDIASELNSIGSCVKTTSGWKKCWSDIKCDVAKKFDSQQTPTQLTPGEFKIAQLYNFIADYQQISDEKEFEMQVGREEPVEEEHLESLYVEERTVSDNVTYLGEIQEEELTNQEMIIPDELPHGKKHYVNVPKNYKKPETPHNFIQIQEEEEAVTPDPAITLLEKLLQEQKRTNDLLERLLEQQTASTNVQTEMLNELKNNSFFVMTNPNRNNNLP